MNIDQQPHDASGTSDGHRARRNPFREANFNVADFMSLTRSGDPQQPRVDIHSTKNYSVAVGTTLHGDRQQWTARAINTTWTKTTRPNHAAVVFTVRNAATTSLLPATDRNVVVLRDGTEIPAEWGADASSMPRLYVDSLETSFVQAALDRFANS